MQEIILNSEPPISTITLNRPDDLNRLTPDSMVLLGEYITGLKSNNDVQAVVITGAGDQIFSAGLLNPEIRSGMSKDEVIAFVRLANTVFDDLAALPQIVIAAINGDIVAGAVELALACDIRTAADDITLSMPEAQWGGFPGAGAPHRLAMAAGHARALELICTGREVTSSELLEYGIVQTLHPRKSLLNSAQSMAKRIGENGPLATRGTKRILRTRRAPGFDEARILSDDLRTLLEWSDDVDEGIAAHREGRKPNFSGR
tara:strand:+ start:1752 stop:2531 length:780 start_codon:yes stop_codon:yes gene_type:complete